MSKLRDELQKRKAGAECDLKIKYIKGIHNIIRKNQ